MSEHGMDECYIATMLSVLREEFGELTEREEAIMVRALTIYIRKITEY